MMENRNLFEQGDKHGDLDRDYPSPLAPAGETNVTSAASASSAASSDTDVLDELKDIDFLLEDIEDKIAPLAL